MFFSIDNYFKKKKKIISTLHNLIDILVTDSSDSRLNELDDNSKKLGLFFKRKHEPRIIMCVTYSLGISSFFLILSAIYLSVMFNCL